MLRFHAEAVAELIDPTALARELAVEEVAGIKLQTRLSGEARQHPPGGRLIHAPHEAKLPHRFVDYPVVIVAAAELKLLVVLADARANGRWRPEVKGRAVHRLQLTRRDQRAVHGRELVRRDRDLVIQDVAFAGQIEIGMLRRARRYRHRSAPARLPAR